MLRRLIFWFFGLFVFIATSWSLMNPSFFRTHDYVHAARIAEVVRAAQDGHFPIRWSENFGYGYGMPLFEFYAPLPFYVGGMFYWLGFDVVTAIKFLYVISSLGAFAGCYKFVSRLSGRVGAMVAAVLFTLAPYRALNLFVRGAVGEAWGMMCLPWVMLGVMMVWKREKFGWAVLALSVSALMLSHNLSMLMFLPLVGTWCLGLLILAWQEMKNRSLSGFGKVYGRVILEWLGGVLAGLGMSAFYFVPALAENSYTKISSILGGYFAYSQHFLYIRQLVVPGWGFGGSEWGPNDGISFFLGFGQWLGLVFAVGLLGFFAWRSWRNRGVSLWKPGQKRLVWLVVLAFVLMSVSLFMTLQRSSFIWDSIAALATIQFPWRWLGPANLWLAVGVGCSVGLVRPKLTRLAVGWFFVAFILAVHWWYFRPESYMTQPSDLYYTDADRIQREMSGILPDYIPKQMPDKLTPPTSVFLVPAGTEKHVEVLIDRTQEKLFKTSFLSAADLNVNVADFPGWAFEIDGKPAEKLPGQSGTIAVSVPAGEHLVGVYFGGTPVRNYADWISALFVVAFVAVLFGQSQAVRQKIQWQEV